jgi:hypothetical protein
MSAEPRDAERSGRLCEPNSLAIIAASWGFIFITVTHAIPFRLDWPVSYFFDPAFSFLNIKHLYGLFSQIPKVNTRLFAQVTLESGTQIIWTSATNDLKDMPPGRRAVSEPYRKFLLDLIVRGDASRSHLYVDTARFIARQVQPEGDPAACVDLYADMTPIPLPNEEPSLAVRRRIFRYTFANDRVMP